MLLERLFLETLKPRKLRGSTGIGRTKQNLLANYDKSDPNYPQELTRLKKLSNGSLTITPKAALNILKIFNITDLSETNPRNLGNTGITISINKGNYTISK